MSSRSIDYGGAGIQKVPALTCEKCGSTHVMMTKHGPECDDCDVEDDIFVEWNETVEMDLTKEMETNETF